MAALPAALFAALLVVVMVVPNEVEFSFADRDGGGPEFCLGRRIRAWPVLALLAGGRDRVWAGSTLSISSLDLFCGAVAAIFDLLSLFPVLVVGDTLGEVLLLKLRPWAETGSKPSSCSGLQPSRCAVR